MNRKNKVCCLTGWNKHLLQLLDEGSACTLLKPHLGILFTCFQMYPSKINHCIKHEADSPDTTRKRQIRRFFLLFLRDIFPFEGMNIGKPDHPNTLMFKNYFFFIIIISNQIKKNQIISIFYVKSTNSHRRILLWKIQTKKIHRNWNFREETSRWADQMTVRTALGLYSPKNLQNQS